MYVWHDNIGVDMGIYPEILARKNVWNEIEIDGNWRHFNLIRYWITSDLLCSFKKRSKLFLDLDDLYLIQPKWNLVNKRKLMYILT